MECHPDQSHFHVGNLDQISKRRAWYPGCRLIWTTINSESEGIDEDNYEDYEVQVWPNSLFWQHLDRFTITPASRLANARTHRHCIDIQIFNMRVGPPMRPVGRIARMIDGYEHGQEPPLRDGPFQGGRVITQVIDMERVKEWMSLCTTTHPLCQEQPIVSSIPCPPGKEATIRLIDVQELKIVPATLCQDEFLALSYVWGNAPGLLTEERLPALSLPGGLVISDMSIPQTISDPIAFVRSLGKRYLWVDSLCIIQDSDADKNDQLPLMPTIYSCATVVIIVATETGCDDATGGIPGLPVVPLDPHAAIADDAGPTTRSRNREAQQTIEVINGRPYITLLPDLHQLLQKTTWNTRGWTFQEAILAPRSIVFTSHQVYWCCQTTTWSEDFASESDESVIIGADSSVFLQRPTRSRSEMGLHHPKTHQCRNMAYCQHAQQFSTRTFKNEEDVFWAFVGVLSRLQNTSLATGNVNDFYGAQAGLFPWGFVWAMPYESLDVAVLWDITGRRKGGQDPCRLCDSMGFMRRRRRLHTVEIDCEDGGKRKRKKFVLKYPSWSWLSTTEPIRFVDSCGDTLLSRVQWHEPIVLGTNESFPYMDSVVSKEAGSGQIAVQGEEYDAGFTVEDYRALRKQYGTWQGAMDYGLLQLTAQTTQLMVTNTMDDYWREDGSVGEPWDVLETRPSWDREDTWVACAIASFCGDEMARAVVPLFFFGSEFESVGEFILLSETNEKYPNWAEDTPLNEIRRRDGCEPIKSQNLMLVEWKGNIAYRQAICSVDQGHWDEIVTTVKRIILG
ncbi:Heterokaryon incompatibility protein (HET) domain containing protein [Rhypophila decipiens]